MKTQIVVYQLNLSSVSWGTKFVLHFPFDYYYDGDKEKSMAIDDITTNFILKNMI